MTNNNKTGCFFLLIFVVRRLGWVVLDSGFVRYWLVLLSPICRKVGGLLSARLGFLWRASREDNKFHSCCFDKHKSRTKSFNSFWTIKCGSPEMKPGTNVGSLYCSSELPEEPLSPLFPDTSYQSKGAEVTGNSTLWGTGLIWEFANLDIRCYAFFLE